ncbi:MAG: outer membrane protein transport protein [Bermanella sp.]
MKHPMVKMSAISAAVLTASTAMAGGFDNSDRSLDILFGEKNILTTSYGQTSVPMGGRIEQGAGSGNTVQSGDVVGDFKRPTIAFRYHVSEEVTCATKYEQPYQAAVAYKDDSLAYAGSSAPISTNYDSESITAVCGYDFSLSAGKLKVYGGPKIQKVKGSFDEDLQPDGSPLTGSSDNLDVQLDGGSEVGYVVGAAFMIPEIALRASITYHSQIDYDADGSLTAIIPISSAELAAGLVAAGKLDPNMESTAANSFGLNKGAAFATSATANTFTPQSVEIKLQSGIAENTLASITMRWSEYSKLAELDITGGNSAITGSNNTFLGGDGSEITLQQLATLGADSLVNPTVSMFSNDTLDYSFGLGRRFSDKLSLGTSFSGSIKLGGKSADTPLGADSTSLRLPGDTAHTLSIGGEYAVLPSLKVNGGFGYTFVDPYIVQETDNSFKAEFSKTEATSFQLGLTYEI